MPSLLQVLTRQDLAPSSRLTRSCLGRPRGSCRSRKTLSRLQELELDGRLDTGQASLKVPRPQQEPYIFSKDKANKGGKFVLLYPKGVREADVVRLVGRHESEC